MRNIFETLNKGQEPDSINGLQLLFSETNQFGEEFVRENYVKQISEYPALEEVILLSRKWNSGEIGLAEVPNIITALAGDK